MAETTYADPPPSHGFDGVPKEVLADLLGGAQGQSDPSLRDYGERYFYTHVLGEGGQGVVVAARDQLLEREVAIKALKAPGDPTREAVLRREAAVCGMLEHPNILPTYDLAEDETGSPFIVMRKIEGVGLEDLLRRAHAPARQTDPAEEPPGRLQLLQIFLQVCHAIEYAHSRGVLHMDLKPQNVKVGPFGEVYVLDWGFAARVDERQRLLGGTPIYIAPERFSGAPPDERCDIYGLGVMLYRILTNAHPREVGKMTFREYREQFRTLTLIPPRQRVRSIPRDLEAICLRAMADDPQRRYASVRDLADDVTRHLETRPVSAFPEGPLRRSWRFVRRHRRRTAVAVVLGLALVTSGALLLRDHRNRLALQRRARARIPLEKAMDLVDQRRDQILRSADPERSAAELRSAFALFARAIEEDPASAEAYYRRGRAHYLVRDMRSALEDFRAAYTLDSSYIMAHYHAGKILADVFRDHAAARREFDAMERVDPDNEYSELGQARIDVAERRFDSALARCHRIEKRNPALADVWYIRGLVFGSRRDMPHYDPRRALTAYDRFLDTSVRENPSAYANRGDLRKHLGDLPGAIADYTAALALNPEYKVAYLNRGDCRRDLGDIDGAIDDYTAALAIDPFYKWALLNRGYLVYKHRGDPEAGLRDMERALRIDPDEFWAYMNRAAIYEATERFEAAARDYERALRLRPKDPIIWYRLGVFHFLHGELAEAEAALNRSLALSADGQKAIRYHRRGIVRLAQGRYAEAAGDFRASLMRRDAGRIYPALMLWIAAQMGGEDLDLVRFERALDAPEGKPWLAALGSVFLGEAAPEEAIRLADSPEARCETFFYLGARDLARGEEATARERLAAAVRTGVHLYMEHGLARRLLETLGDPGESAEESDASPASSAKAGGE